MDDPKLLPPPPPPTKTAAANHRPLENFRSLMMKCATASARTQPLTFVQKTFIEQRIRELFPCLRTPRHPPYASMIENAIIELKSEWGSSEEAISKFILEQHKDLPWAHATLLKQHLQNLCKCSYLTQSDDGFYLLGKAISRLNPTPDSVPSYKAVARPNPSHWATSPSSSSSSSSSHEYESSSSSPEYTSGSNSSSSGTFIPKRKRKMSRRRGKNFKGRGRDRDWEWTCGEPCNETVMKERTEVCGFEVQNKVSPDHKATEMQNLVKEDRVSGDAISKVRSKKECKRGRSRKNIISSSNQKANSWNRRGRSQKNSILSSDQTPKPQTKLDRPCKRDLKIESRQKEDHQFQPSAEVILIDDIMANIDEDTVDLDELIDDVYTELTEATETQNLMIPREEEQHTVQGIKDLVNDDCIAEQNTMVIDIDHEEQEYEVNENRTESLEKSLGSGKDMHTEETKIGDWDCMEELQFETGELNQPKENQSEWVEIRDHDEETQHDMNKQSMAGEMCETDVELQEQECEENNNKFSGESDGAEEQNHTKQVKEHNGADGEHIQLKEAQNEIEGLQDEINKSSVCKIEQEECNVEDFVKEQQTEENVYTESSPAEEVIGKQLPWKNDPNIREHESHGTELQDQLKGGQVDIIEQNCPTLPIEEENHFKKACEVIEEGSQQPITEQNLTDELLLVLVVGEKEENGEFEHLDEQTNQERETNEEQLPSEASEDHRQQNEDENQGLKEKKQDEEIGEHEQQLEDGDEAETGLNTVLACEKSCESMMLTILEQQCNCGEGNNAVEQQSDTSSPKMPPDVKSVESSSTVNETPQHRQLLPRAGKSHSKQNEKKLTVPSVDKSSETNQSRKLRHRPHESVEVANKAMSPKLPKKKEKGNRRSLRLQNSKI